MRRIEMEGRADVKAVGLSWPGLALVFVASFLGTVFLLRMGNTALGKAAGSALAWLFAANSVEIVWYITRSAGWVAYLLLWLSMVWGLAVPSKLFDGLLPRLFTFESHEYISLLALGFTGLHMVVLMFGSYLPYSLAQVLLPFISTYRPFWVGIGVLATYLILLVTVTYYIRAIHTLSLVGFVGAALHGLLAGTDSYLPIAQWTYLGTVGVTALLTAHWLWARGDPRAAGRG
jgi:sulfoxide reductase heme-binding subunit YedZ